MTDQMDLFNLYISLQNKVDTAVDDSARKAYKDAADALYVVLKPDPSTQADPNAERFHELRPKFSKNKVLQMSTDGNSVTLSMHAFEQVHALLPE